MVVHQQAHEDLIIDEMQLKYCEDHLTQACFQLVLIRSRVLIMGEKEKKTLLIRILLKTESDCPCGNVIISQPNMSSAQT